MLRSRDTVAASAKHAVPANHRYVVSNMLFRGE